MVSSVKFYKIPDYRIVDNVKRNDLTVKTLFFQDEKQNEKTGEIQERFIKLNGMKQSIERNSREAVGIFIMEFYTPGNRTFRTPAASRSEAS